MSIFNAFNEAAGIKIYHDGEVSEFDNKTEQFKDILTVWNDTCLNARDMPAYGVSLNSETLKAIKHGLWLEFCFEELKFHNEMPYQKLLVEVKAEWTGFNIIRYVSENGYDGRCFYFNLVTRDMSALYNILNSEIKIEA